MYLNTCMSADIKGDEQFGRVKDEKASVVGLFSRLQLIRNDDFRS